MATDSRIATAHGGWTTPRAPKWGSLKIRTLVIHIKYQARVIHHTTTHSTVKVGFVEDPNSGRWERGGPVQLKTPTQFWLNVFFFTIARWLCIYLEWFDDCVELWIETSNRSKDVQYLSFLSCNCIMGLKKMEHMFPKVDWRVHLVTGKSSSSINHLLEILFLLCHSNNFF